jgi:UDP-2,3-diacylglucosamine pyrophosphatase LpxH
LKDFSKAKYTAVISDLHLCEAEPVHPRYPLWKKYKTREFFFDDTFYEFLRHINEMAEGAEVELVLNGDIFDFDSVTSLPEEPPFRVSWLEVKRGLYPEEEKSVFKIERILDDHKEWFSALRWFLQCGHRVVFVIGNHDLELHWPAVQAKIMDRMQLPEPFRENMRFCEWFYISNGDTFIEHGNQQDAYCLCLDPLNPFVLQYNKVEIRLPFGNIASRYMINGMGFFNPHVDSNYIMSIVEYLKFFFRYMARAQPLLIWTWFWGAFLTLTKSISDTLLPALRDPLRTEDRIDEIAEKSNAAPRMVRELRELFAHPATHRPIIVARELWLDRAFLILLTLIALLEVNLFIKQVYDLSFFWMFIPILLFVPFFLFYSRSIQSNVAQYKEPRDDILAMTGAITKTNRVVYGHTHVVRHEIIGAIEHLNPGSWSPAFLDVECTKPIGQKTFVWIQPGAEGVRESRVYHFGGDAAVKDGARMLSTRTKSLA